MLDVHPAHSAAQSWKDFFIHLATITIGLLLAISLEQFVETLHHRHQVREARAALQEEHQENIQRFHRNVRIHLRSMALLHNNYRVLTFLRDHPATPEAQLPGAVLWPIFVEEPLKAAWSAAGSANVLALMPTAEIRKYTADYAQLDYAWQLYQPVLTALSRCTAYQAHASDVTTLTAAQISALIDCIEYGEAQQAVYGDQLSEIGRDPDYAPIPDWWHMLPFNRMGESFERAKTNTDAYARTLRDLDEAMAADPAGPPAESSKDVRPRAGSAIERAIN
jgi:hypothetical protein